MNKFQGTIFDLSGCNVVVIGGSGLIGVQSCAILLEAGASVTAVDVGDTKIFHNRLAGIVNDKEQLLRANHAFLDVTKEADTEEFAAGFKGPIDIVVNHSHYKASDGELVPFGRFFQPAENYPLDVWSKTLATNLDGLLISTKAFGKRMMAQGAGVFINTSSTYGLVSPNPMIYGDSGINSPISYATTKAAIVNFTKYIATHWAPYGIRANCLCPGGVASAGQSMEFKENYASNVPLGRLSDPSELKGAVLFLASSASSYMTGAELKVDGGWTAW